MIKASVDSILQEIDKIELKAGRVRYEALPVLHFFIGLVAGLLLSMSANILHEQLREYQYYKLAVLLLTVVTLSLILLIIEMQYLTPIRKLNKINDENFKKLIELLND